YSAPTYSTLGLPPEVSAGASTFRGTACTLPAPTLSSVACGTPVTALTTAVLAAAARADGVEVEPAEPPEPTPAAFATTSPTSSTTTTPMLPPASSTRRRRAARACSARIAATLSSAAALSLVRLLIECVLPWGPAAQAAVSSVAGRSGPWGNVRQPRSVPEAARAGRCTGRARRRWLGRTGSPPGRPNEPTARTRR